MPRIRDKCNNACRFHQEERKKRPKDRFCFNSVWNQNFGTKSRTKVYPKKFERFFYCESKVMKYLLPTPGVGDVCHDHHSPWHVSRREVGSYRSLYLPLQFSRELVEATLGVHKTEIKRATKGGKRKRPKLL